MSYQKLKIERYRNLGGINAYDSLYQGSDTEFLDLRNWMFERPGALTSRPGTEYHLTLHAGSFLVRPYNTVQYVQRTGSSFIVFDSGQTLNVYAGGVSSVFGPITGSPTTGLVADTENYDNCLFFGNGSEFGFLRAAEFSKFNLIKPDSGYVGESRGLTFNTALSGITATIASGTWIVSFQYARGYDDIFRGPFYGANANLNKFGVPNLTPVIAVGVGATVQTSGKWVFWGFSVPVNYGISGVVPILNRVTDGVTVFRYATATAVYPTLMGGVTYYHAEFNHLDSSIDLDLSRSPFTLMPKHLAVFNNHMVVAGQTISPNTVYFSEPGEPDNIQPENFFEVLSGDGDIIKSLAVFQDALIIFKNRSVFELTGDTADNFQLRVLTKEYGLVSEKGWVVFENSLWFIDQSGVVQYDGANFIRVSRKVDSPATESIESYLNMVDKTKITAHHVKKDRQVWFSSGTKSFVFDYDVKAWTIFDDIAMDKERGVAVIDYGSTRSDVSYWRTGTSFQEFVRFGDSLNTDLGQAITLIHQTRFHKRLEHTTQELWRRYYFNYEIPGSTQGITIQVMPDYGSSVYATRSGYLNAFQNRVEFGVSSRSLSVKSILQASQPIRFNGYVLESRFLRKI